MTNPDGRLDEIASMMPRDAVEKDGLTRGIGRQIRRRRQLLKGRGGTSHGDDEPADTLFPDNLILLDILRIVAIDRREGQDGLNLLAMEDSSEWPGTLPGPSDYPPREDHRDAFLSELVPGQEG